MDVEILGAEESDSLRQSAYALSAQMMARGDTITAASAQLGIADRTLQRWRKQEEWQRAYKAAQAEIIGRARNRLVALTEVALNRIEDHLREEDPDRARKMASQADTAWKVLKTAGVEIEVVQQEAPRRIVTRLPQATSSAIEPVATVPDDTVEDNQPGQIREVRRGW